mmetsp:Transcript_12116/g.22441  ORF Transcript_12116/g.22441 Transcript_12116/m.22441 type:complete len:115 (+) Transcript_12116:162-506(+)
MQSQIRNNIESEVLSEFEKEELPIPKRSVYFASEYGTLRRREGDKMTPLSNKSDSAFQTILSRHELKNQSHIVQVVVAKDIEKSIQLINAKIPTLNDNKRFSNRNSFNINKWAY